MATNQKLPQKESGIFKKLVRCYECKQYKNGLKFAKQILGNPKFAEHGETLAMKGLILNFVGRKEEAYENVRRGLKNDIKSHVCWHVYGLLQRSDKKYNEAIKCYRNALKHDKENVQILRDLSLLQIQIRDQEGFRDTRYQLLKVRPAQRSSWVGYALSYHMLKDYEMALKVMAEYRKTQSQPTSLPDYEFSEMILYEVELLSESRNYSEALKHLDTYRQFISDELSYQETKGQILIEEKRLGEAELIYRDLLVRNSENYEYYEKLEKCLILPTDEDRLLLYQVLREDFPRSHVCRRIPLGFVNGPLFQEMLDKYLRPPIHKGVPSLFMDLKPLYRDPDKASIIGETVHGYLSSLEACSKFHPSDPDPEEPPTALLWVWFFLSQHYDMIGDSELSLEYINKAIDHTPTHIELYMMKSTIYKHGGDYEAAAKWMDEARSMDTADRFVNCKSVKYFLRVNEIERAIETAGMFTRDGLPPLQMLDEMQCMWFQTELARAYWRLACFGEALVKYHEIDKHFEDIIEDQFDFHTYCMRKMTLRAYVGVLRLEDKLQSHKSFFKAAQDAIELYLYLHDKPDARHSKAPPVTPTVENDLSHLSASERKKVQRKQRKALAKAQAKAELEKEKENKHNTKQEDEKKSHDDSKPKFNSKELLEVEKPLEEAMKFLIPLQTLCSERIETHLLAYSIHSRRRKYLLMLQSLKRSFNIDQTHPKVHLYLIDFILLLEREKPDFPDPVKLVIEETIPRLTSGRSLDDMNHDFIITHSKSLSHLMAGAQVMYRLHSDKKNEAILLITSLSDELTDKSLKTCQSVFGILKSGTLGDCSNVIGSYVAECHKLFPLATCFKPPLDALAEKGVVEAISADASACVGVCGRKNDMTQINTQTHTSDISDPV